MVESGKDCATMGAICKITCTTCQTPIELEEGPQTSRQPGGQLGPNNIRMTMTSIHCRMVDHLTGQKARRENNPLHRHDLKDHGGSPQSFKTRILGRERRILPLTILEALYIEGQSKGTSFNDINEYGRGQIVRLTASRGLT